MPAKSDKYSLDPKTLDEISAEISVWLDSLGIPKSDAIRFRFTMEEVLIRIMEHGGENQTVELIRQKRFGRCSLLLRYGGDQFNPVTAGEDEAEEYSIDILSRLNLLPTWNYRGGVNTLQLSPPKAGGKNQLFYLLAAVLSAVLIGVLGNLVFPGLRAELVAMILDPLSAAFIGLLTTFAGLMVFLTVASSIFGAGNVSSVSQMAKTVFISIILSLFVQAFITVLPFRFIMGSGRTGSGGRSELESVSEIIFGILPGDPVTPFQSGNIMQILVLAVAVGLVLLIMDEAGRSVKILIEDCSTAVNMLMGYICKLIPVYVFSSLLTQIWSKTPAELLNIWKPLAVLCIAGSVLSAAVAFAVSLKVKCSASLLIRSVMPASMIAFTTNSSMAAYSTGVKSCEKDLGIEKKLVDFSYPISNVMNKPGVSIGFAVILIYLADLYDVETSVTWFVLCAVMTAIMGIACPPVAGATITCISILMSQLGIPEQGMLQAIALAVISEYFITFIDVLQLQLVMVWQAHNLNMIDRSSGIFKKI